MDTIRETDDIFVASFDGARFYKGEQCKPKDISISLLEKSLDYYHLLQIYEQKWRPNLKKSHFNEIETSEGIMNVYNAFVVVSFDRYVIQDGKRISSKAIREYLYENGLTFNNNKYIRYKRSAGSARQGKCLFILEKLYDQMNEWSCCGISEDSKAVKNDMVSWEAYKALTLSGVETSFKLEPKNILVLPDYESPIVGEKVYAITTKNKLPECEIRKLKEGELSNKIWDGEGLLDESVFNSIDQVTFNKESKARYKDKGMILLRNRFFKCAAFNTRLQKFFKDNQITEMFQLNQFGITLAKRISDIKLVSGIGDSLFEQIKELIVIK